MKHVVIFGLSNNGPEASRNTVLCRAFSQICSRTSYCTINFGFARPDAKPVSKIVHALVHAPLRWLWLGLKYLTLPPHDLVFIPYPSHTDAWLVLILGGLRKKPVVLDAFYGIYDTAVRDRRTIKETGLLARLIWHYEKWLLRAADFVLVDTDDNAAMFIKDFNIDSHRITVVPVGVDETLWKPVSFPPVKPFQVVFWSTFIPLHGAEVVAHAAKLLEEKHTDINFLVIGNGQLGQDFAMLIKKLKSKNLKWIDRFIPLPEISKHVKTAGCCLGVFGNTEKAQRVIPYKAYQSLASAKPLITARTRACEKVFTDGENALLVNLNDPLDLSKAILKLAQNPEMAANIGKKGNKLYHSRLSNRIIKANIEKSIFKTLAV
jgi:glycosyltransferase involved in cell wall biosynthesis